MKNILSKIKEALENHTKEDRVAGPRGIRIVWKKSITSSNPLCEPKAEQTIAGHRVTPYYVSKLDENEVFVFGSNIYGEHDGGASECALINFGARMGQAEGPQGQSYAIPTDGCSFDDIKKAIDRFILYAEAHPKLTFLVTEIGCGTAGYHPNEIAPLFMDAFNIHNIYLPRQFWKHIK